MLKFARITRQNDAGKCHMKTSTVVWEAKVENRGVKNAYSLDKVQQTLANTGYFQWIMDVNLAKVGQNSSWPTRDINVLLEMWDNYCDILFENGWTLLNCLLLVLIRKSVGDSKHRRKNGCSSIGLLSYQEPKELFEKLSVFANGIWRYSLFNATQFLRRVLVVLWKIYCIWNYYIVCVL